MGFTPATVRVICATSRLFCWPSSTNGYQLLERVLKLGLHILWTSSLLSQLLLSVPSSSSSLLHNSQCRGRRSLAKKRRKKMRKKKRIKVIMRTLKKGMRELLDTPNPSEVV